MSALPFTTLARIRAESPCESGYRKLVRNLGGVRKYGRDTPVTVRQMVESNGLDDALWALCTMPECDARWRLLAVRYARRVQHLMTDPRSVNCIDVAERYARGQATVEELEAAEGAAGASARAAEWTPEWAAAGTAAWRNPAWAVAADAAGVAHDAAKKSERDWQAQELIRISEEPQP